MFTFCFLLTINIICMVLLAWIWIAIIKLYTNKHYRECPPYVPSFGIEKKIIINRTAEILKKTNRKLIILDPGCGCGSLLLK